METTIKISSDVKSKLDSLKLFEKETYNDIIKILLEDNLDLSVKTKKEIKDARERISKGKFITQEEIEKRLGI